ncbi:hypothetical protein XENTR_v10004795 [Xenopus tropicalis]|uniref:Zinc finger and BTB domain containing 21 n=1 Tax=Xenopus tropicalis TaxID=8364 RepID=A1A5F0_XENTR|nr:zinc finger and BTB domain-containing protein 21 [Xenopus tropicalis]XP_031751403.1 zinc finger and BTB domain-containing protein 21 isoform X1 [Xenopus tropicalis]AAI28622.1 znf295 protein [Xenopus tropicalis]KAE8621363.1 hypothetical protein XENTR_v10004795 [Xenopus tropicalis]|eukprot:NP_001090699.1 zinc finger and BTB domain-containing protein 21 [Xenopus tropicalis]
MEGLIHYLNPEHASSMLSALNEERLKEEFCDVLLIVGDQKFRAHKNILAATSEYFQSLFTEKDNESQTVFQLDFCDADVFENVLNYIYSSSIFVEKSSLAAVQELGYSLGINFLTNIVSKTPQTPFPSIKNAEFKEEDESGSQQRSVIVCQNRIEAQERDISHLHHDKSRPLKPSLLPQGKTHGNRPLMRLSEPPNSLLSERKWRNSYVSDDQGISRSVKRKSTLPQKSFPSLESNDKPGISGCLLRNTSETFEKQMLASVPPSYSSSEYPYSSLIRGKESVPIKEEEEENVVYYSKVGLTSSAGSTHQNTDRSGPLVKSLLRRSLSMDSPVPAYSHSPDFSLEGTSAMIENCNKAVAIAGFHNQSKTDLDLDARDNAQEKCNLKISFVSSKPHSRESIPEKDVHIKKEPGSPPSETSEIFRVTVGDTSQPSNRDVPIKAEETPNIIKMPIKRKLQADRRMLPSRRVKMKSAISPDATLEEGALILDADSSDSESSRELYGEASESRQNKKFKCKHCLKIFRSTAGLNRHVNMYHNPEKPYACDICHKRFHTNFKVWTHCQTQHGIVRNPSPASSGSTVLDDKFQRKLVDIVREREIKKALLFRLRRGKQGFQGSSGSPAQALRRSLRSRSKSSYICNHCGKSYRFLSQFKQHCKMHPGEKNPFGSKENKPKAPSPPKSPVDNKEFFNCRLCNAKFPSFVEQGNHERMCRNATLCPYCSLRFASPDLKNEHESKCEYKKLTCLECMRTFKSSFSIWRHQVEVHNQNTMAPTENFSLPLIDHNGEVRAASRMRSLAESSKVNSFLALKEDGIYSDSSDHMNFDSEDSNCLPEDLSLSKQFHVQVKEEPADDMEDGSESNFGHKEDLSDSERGVWACEKCGKIFTVHKQLERHQELLCTVKPFICHVCNKAFRTNFRLWSHFQSHMPNVDDSSLKEPEASAPLSSPSPPPPAPPPPPPPPPPKLQPAVQPSCTTYPEKITSPKMFAPQESDTLFYHAPPLSAITFKRQFMCKLCHRTFKTAFSLWSHEQSHN